jgi:ketosteroid isomerase-like protein
MGRSIQRTFLAAVILSSVLIAPAQPAVKNLSAASQTRRLILELERQGREATLKNDIEANDRLLADNWLNVNPDGSVTTKAQLMELLKAGTFKITSIENEGVLVRTYGDTSIVTGLSTTKRAGQNGVTISGQVRFTRVYTKTHGRWQVVSAHNTLVRQP